MGTHPNLTPINRWTYRKGAAFGMKGASLSARIAVTGVPDVECATLEGLLLRTFEKDLPAAAVHMPMVGPAALHRAVNRPGFAGGCLV